MVKLLQRNHGVLKQIQTACIYEGTKTKHQPL